MSNLTLTLPPTKNSIAGTKTHHLVLNYADTHRALVESCKQGRREAQFELYRLYGKAMYNVCLRMLRNETDAEDLLQNSFTDVFTKLHTFRYQSSIGAWIKRITVNNCINFLKRRRLRFEEFDDRHSGLLTADDDPVADNHLNVERIQHAILQLPDGYRVVFSLYLLEGYDHREIASILNISEATSKSQYSRAKSKLKEILKSSRIG